MKQDDLKEAIDNNWESIDKIYSIYHRGRKSEDCTDGSCEWDELMLEITKIIKQLKEEK